MIHVDPFANFFECLIFIFSLFELFFFSGYLSEENWDFTGIGEA